MLPPIPRLGGGSILIQYTPMSIRTQNSWLCQGLALLLWLACMKPASSSSLSAFSSDHSCRSHTQEFACLLIHPKQTKQLLAQSLQQTVPPSYQDSPRKSQYKRSRKQVRSLSVQAIGTATLGSLSITKAFGAAPYKNNWLSPLSFAITIASAIGAFYYLQQRLRRRNGSIKDTYLLSVPQATLPAPTKDSDRKSIHATAEIYWNKQLYQGSATEIGPQSMRVEVDDVIRGLKILMPVGLTISQDATEPPQRFIVQVVSIQPLATAGNHRSVLELRFPNRWQQQQNKKVKALINVLR